MPHFTLEYSANLTDLDVTRCLAAVNGALAASGHFQEVDIKSRAFRADCFLVGVQAQGRAFVAGRLAVLTGRTEDTRRQMAEIALQALQPCVAAVPGLHIQVSVEVVEMQRDIYAKAIVSSP